MKKTKIFINICTVEGCENTNIASKEKGWCWKHYRRWLRNGDVSDPEFINKGKSCIVSDCQKPAKANGYCSKHLDRIYAHQSPHIIKKVDNHKDDTCIMKGCDLQVSGGVLCRNHYANYHYYKQKGKVSSTTDYMKMKRGE